jgi:hypothetical protein
MPSMGQMALLDQIPYLALLLVPVVVKAYQETTHLQPALAGTVALAVAVQEAQAEALGIRPPQVPRRGQAEALEIRMRLTMAPVVGAVRLLLAQTEVLQRAAMAAQVLHRQFLAAALLMRVAVAAQLMLAVRAVQEALAVVVRVVPAQILRALLERPILAAAVVEVAVLNLLLTGWAAQAAPASSSSSTTSALPQFSPSSPRRSGSHLLAR